MDVDDNIRSHHPSRQSKFRESDSPLKSQAGIVGTYQGGLTEDRPHTPPGPGDQGSKVPEGQETLKSRGDLFEGKVDSRNSKANMEVYNAFIGHPKKHDPSHVKFKETG